MGSDEKLPLESGNVTNFCANSCLGICVRMRYSATRIYGSSIKPGGAQIDFIVQLFQYSLFTETDLWSIERFFCAIVRLTGIFLGLNILIVACFANKLISLLVNFIRRRREVKRCAEKKN